LKIFFTKNKISSIKLENFKRFTDLEIKNIPNKAKLVLLIGARGSGKIAIFDAFEQLISTTKHGSSNSGFENEYFRKDKTKEFLINVAFSDGNSFKRNNHYEFSNRIEIQNPSHLYGNAKCNFLRVSDYRNPIIATVLKNLGYVNRFTIGITNAKELLTDVTQR
jgi:AAA15 family ATPase/GTPase